MTAYCICCTVSYLPGGWIGDKFNPKPVLLISIFGQAALSFLFMFTYKSYAMAVIIWLLMGLTGGFAFWPAIMKGIRLTGTDEEQGRMYGIFEALNGFASLLLSFIMIGVMAVVGGSDLITRLQERAGVHGRPVDRVRHSCRHPHAEGRSLRCERGRKAEEDHLQGLCVRV